MKLRRARPSRRRSRQWGNESSGNAACLVLLSLLIGSRFKDSFVRSKAFSHPGLVIGRVPRNGAPYSNNSIKGSQLSNSSISDYPRRSPRVDRVFLYRAIPRRGSFRSRHDIVPDRALRWTTMTLRGQRCESSCPVCLVATTHVLSLSTVKSKPENVLIPVRFQRGTLARSRNPAIAIDGFLRNLAIVASRAAKLMDGHDDDIHVRKEFLIYMYAS